MEGSKFEATRLLPVVDFNILVGMPRRTFSTAANSGRSNKE